MNRISWKPSAELREYFSTYHVIESDTEDFFRYPVKAGPKAALAFFLSGSFSMETEGGGLPFPETALIGPVLSAYTVIFPAGHSGVVIAEFTETGCYELLRENPHTVLNACKDASDSIAAADVAEFKTAVIESASDPEKKITALEKLLLGIVKTRKEVSKGELLRILTVKQAADHVKSGVDRVSVEELASSMSVSERTLQRSFQTITGLSPKQYIDLVRFTKLFHLYFENKSAFAEIFYQSSYYDQSHIIKKFRKYAGLSPGKVLKHPFNFSSGLSHHFAQELEGRQPR